MNTAMSVGADVIGSAVSAGMNIMSSAPGFFTG